MRKAQTGSTDLFVAITIFTLLFVLIVLTWNNYAITLNSKFDFQEIQIKAFHISELLVKTAGSPSLWEDQEDPSRIVELGLAKKPNVISKEKAVRIIDSNFLDKEDIRDILNINSYNFTINITDPNGVIKQENGNPLSFGDTQPTVKQSVVIIKRPVLYETENAILKVVLWKK